MAVNSYNFIVVSPEFLENGTWNASDTSRSQLARNSDANMTWMLETWHGLDLVSAVQSMQMSATDRAVYERLEKVDCLVTYNDLLGNRSDLIIVSSGAAENANSLLVYGMAASGTWDVGYIL